MTETIVLACVNDEAPPLFHAIDTPDAERSGYEPDVARLLEAQLGARIEWKLLPWEQMIPAVQQGLVDGILCGQGYTEERAAQVAFTEPYACFDETVLVRADEPATTPEELRGFRIAAIHASTNMKLAETFPEVTTVGFGDSNDPFIDMIAALKRGEVDALVDDDVVTIPLDADPDLRVAFTAPTRNPWAIAVAHGNTELLSRLNRALTELKRNGELETAWNAWMPHLGYPF